MDHALDRLAAGGSRKVVVNGHYLAVTVEAHLAAHHNGMRIAISDERGKVLEAGIGLPVEGHIWRPGKKNWGYQVATGEQDYLARFRRKMDEVIRQAKEEGLSASVYT